MTPILYNTVMRARVTLIKQKGVRGCQNSGLLRFVPIVLSKEASLVLLLTQYRARPE